MTKNRPATAKTLFLRTHITFTAILSLVSSASSPSSSLQLDDQTDLIRSTELLLLVVVLYHSPAHNTEDCPKDLDHSNKQREGVEGEPIYNIVTLSWAIILKFIWSDTFVTGPVVANSHHSRRVNISYMLPSTFCAWGGSARFSSCNKKRSTCRSENTLIYLFYEWNRIQSSSAVYESELRLLLLLLLWYDNSFVKWPLAIIWTHLRWFLGKRPLFGIRWWIKGRLGLRQP